MEKPKRIHIRRGVKGWRMPPNSKSVARPHRWGNPYDWRLLGRDEAIRLYREWLIGKDLTELRGKNLACYCKLDQPCHADVLLELANK
jgi:hypothetical protein